MSEFKHTISKEELKGVAGDPDLTISNASEPLHDRPITARNAVEIGATIAYAKQTMQQIGGALIRQTGNAQLERNVNNAKKGLTYLTLGVVSGGIGLPFLAVASDVSTKLINGLEAQQQINFENERKVSVRGGMTTLNNTYD